MQEEDENEYDARSRIYREREGVWRPDIICNLVRLEYDAATRTGVLWLRHGNCVHMPGAINLFLGIDADAEMVFTFQRGGRWDESDVPDTAYMRYRDQPETSDPLREWRAIPHRFVQDNYARRGKHFPQMLEWMI